jgi:uncharacterized membrane protein (DUF106 family)
MILYLNIILTIIALILGVFLSLNLYSFIVRRKMENHMNKMTKEQKIDFRTFDFRQIPTKLSEIRKYLKNNK